MRQDIKQIRQVLRTYARLKDDLKEVSLLPSPQTDKRPVSSPINHTEQAYLYHASLTQHILRIERAIAAIEDERYRFVIRNYVIKKKYNRAEMCQRLQLSLRGFNYLKNRALIEFAKNYGMKFELEAMNQPTVYDC